MSTSVGSDVDAPLMMLCQPMANCTVLRRGSPRQNDFARIVKCIHYFVLCCAIELCAFGNDFFLCRSNDGRMMIQMLNHDLLFQTAVEPSRSH
jgi:hypothetical protein